MSIAWPTQYVSAALLLLAGCRHPAPIPNHLGYRWMCERWEGRPAAEVGRLGTPSSHQRNGRTGIYTYDVALRNRVLENTKVWDESSSAWVDGLLVGTSVQSCRTTIQTHDDRVVSCFGTGNGCIHAAPAFLGVGARPVKRGLEITEVEPLSAAARLRLVEGDVLVRVAGFRVRSLAALDRVLGFFSGGTRISLRVVRDGKANTRDVEVAVPPAGLLDDVGLVRSPYDLR